MMLVTTSYHHFLRSPAPAPAPPFTASNHSSSEPYGWMDKSFQWNVITFLSILLLAIVCSLVLKFTIRCALSRSSSGDFPARPPNTGVNRNAMKTLPVVRYSPELRLPGFNSECAICLSEFAAGERIRLFPKCHHGFHIECINMWLSAHSSCPTCRDCLIETSQKIVSCSPSQVAASSSSGLGQDQPVQMVIQPPEPEDSVRRHHV
ncbi:hypothetical protein SAY87_029024 [Trapa incisa]|uniref:RING-type E3 ubiquitin transferase n=1 Tax=Trapa incisa TaxID=236973 RepID=A0AAN7QSL1_9MYRT|nr:hypothetical protein SAY87_029024 [Trapa incisa]